MCMFNRIYIGPGNELHWNGAKVIFATLNRYLSIIRNMAPVPFTELAIRPGADCGMIAQVRASIERAVPCEPGWHCSFSLVEARPPPRRRRR